MPILMECQCGRRIRARDELAGKRVKCPQCSAVLTVPPPTAAAPPVQRERRSNTEEAVGRMPEKPSVTSRRSSPPPQRSGTTTPKRSGTKTKQKRTPRILIWGSISVGLAIAAGLAFWFLRSETDSGSDVAASANVPDSLPETADNNGSTIGLSSETAAEPSAEPADVAAISDVPLPPNTAPMVTAEPLATPPEATLAPPAAEPAPPVVQEPLRPPNTNPAAYTEGGGRRTDDPEPGQIPETALGEGTVTVMVRGVSNQDGTASYVVARLIEMTSVRPAEFTASNEDLEATINGVVDARQLADVVDFGTVTSVTADRIEVQALPSKMPQTIPLIQPENTALNQVEQLRAFQNAFREVNSARVPKTENVENLLQLLTHWEPEQRRLAIGQLAKIVHTLPTAQKKLALSALQLRTKDVDTNVKMEAEKQQSKFAAVAPPKAGEVRIVVTGASPSAVVSISMRAQELTRSGSINTKTVNGTLTVTASGGADVQTLAPLIDFGKVTDVDAENRTIYVDATGASIPQKSLADMMAAAAGTMMPEAPKRIDVPTDPNPLAPTTVEGIDLAPRSFLNDRVTLLVPVDFQEMDEAQRKSVYALTQDISQALTNEANTVKIGLGQGSGTMPLMMLPLMAGTIKESMKARPKDSGEEWIDTRLLQIHGRDWIVNEFRAGTADTKIYSQMALGSLDGRAFTIRLDCSVQEEAKWRAVGNAIIASLRITEIQ